MVDVRGKSRFWQSTEQRQHKEDPERAVRTPEASHPGDSAEDQSALRTELPLPGNISQFREEGEAQSRNSRSRFLSLQTPRRLSQVRS